MSGEAIPMSERAERHLGARLERVRMDRGLSQDEAAERLGVSQATFSRWVAGVIPRSSYWTAISRFLGIPRAEVAELVNEARMADRDGERMTALEDRFDRLETKVDLVLEALDRVASPARRRGR